MGPHALKAFCVLQDCSLYLLKKKNPNVPERGSYDFCKDRNRQVSDSQIEQKVENLSFSNHSHKKLTCQQPSTELHYQRRRYI